VKEEHVDGQYVTWNFNLKDYVDGRHVTGIITTEDHGDRHHVTDVTAAQQQPGDSGLTGKLNQTNR